MARRSNRAIIEKLYKGNKSYSSKLTLLKILYKEKVKYKCFDDKKIEKILLDKYAIRILNLKYIKRYVFSSTKFKYNV